MKKTYILSESQYQRLVERDFVNQEFVDNILDKISAQGEESLTDLERYILKNPNEPIVKYGDQDDDCIEDVIKLLFLNRLVDGESMKVYEDFIEVSKFADAPNLDYFNGENFIRFYCLFDDGRKVMMDFADNGESREEVKAHIKNVWENKLPDTEFIVDDDFPEFSEEN
jgi:hypothetical protein